MAKKVIFKLLLIFIVAGAFFLRFWSLDKSPPGFNWDEVSHAYNAYSILKTGRDEWGKPFPFLNFRAYGDYPAALNLYLTIPFIYFFGLNEFAVRLPHLLLGVLTVIGTYFLSCGLTGKKEIGLISAFLVAVSPWNFFTSRVVLQSNLSVFFLTIAMSFFYFRKKKSVYFFLTLIFFTLTLLSYHTTRIFSPLFLGYLIFQHWREFKNKLAIFLVFLFFTLTVFIFLNPESRARSRWVFLIDNTAVSKIVEKRQASKLPFILKRIFYNRPIYFISEFTKNYFGYFSPNFLFIKGGTQYQFSLPNHGLEYFINLPFFYLGLFFLFVKVFKEKNKNYQSLLVWLALSPIAASITNEKFAVIRSTPMIPLVEIISAMGLVGLIKNRKWIYFPYFGGILLMMFLYLNNYFGSYRINYSWVWQKGYKEAISYLRKNQDRYAKIILTKKYGEPHEFLLFYLKYDPQKYQKDPNLIRFNQSDWWWVDHFDKFYFVNDWQVKDLVLESGGKVDCKEAKCLLISSPGNSPAGWKTLTKIYFNDGQAAFEIYEN